ncbi:MAG: hypothetical protein O7D30_09375 [Rickettsia endosymbiont of Ixodes persulcatus]|nr:hypothetical protein [Rickettsia endosymbiont of Ixodes persulcatus]
MEEHKEQVVDSLKHLHETTKLSILNRIIATTKGQDNDVAIVFRTVNNKRY